MSPPPSPRRRKRPKRRRWPTLPSGLVGLVVGGVYGLVALYDRERSDVAWLPPWLTGRWEALGWSLVVTALAIAVTTAVLGRQSASAPRSERSGGWLERSREELPPVREHPFPDGVPLLLRAEWFAVALILLTAYVVFGLFW